MARDLIIWKNEALLIKESIKNKFNKYYKHLGLNLICETENELLKGIHITLIESKLNLRKEDFVSTSGLFSIKDYEDYVLIRIQDLFNEMFKNYYTI